MLNYILPPIIIVVSVSVLIMFLFRKAQQIPEQNIETSESGFGKEEKFSLVFSTLGHFGLKILERLMHRLKLASLRFHNVSNDMFQSIREKRQQKVVAQKEFVEKNNVERNVRNGIVDLGEIEREKVVRPMIREDVTRPQSQQSRIKEKNQFEEALIKRIAINPKDIEAYERLGDYYLESANMQDSLECFKQVLRLSPSHHKARLRIKRLEKALK